MQDGLPQATDKSAFIFVRSDDYVDENQEQFHQAIPRTDFQQQQQQQQSLTRASTATEPASGRNNHDNINNRDDDEMSSQSSSCVPSASPVAANAATATGPSALHVPPNNNSFSAIPVNANIQDTAALEERVREVSGGVSLTLDRVVVKSKFKDIRDPAQRRAAIEKEFNKHIDPEESCIVNAGARSGTRVNVGYIFCAKRNGRAEIRFGANQRLTTTIVAGYTDVQAVGGTQGDGVSSELEPLIGDCGTYLVTVPPGKFGKIVLGQVPVLLGEGPHVIHDATFRADRSDMLVDQSNPRISHGILHVIRVPPAKIARVTVNNTPLLLPHRIEPYVFNTAFFAAPSDIFVNESENYISHSPIHVVRVPAGQVARLWQGSKPLLLEYRDSPYFFSDPAFRAESPLFVSGNQKMIVHGSITRLRPGSDGRLEKAVVQSDGQLTFVDRFTILDSVHDVCLGFLDCGIRTLVLPSRETREERRRDNPQATSDEINFESASTSDSLKIGLRLVVAVQVTDPGLCLSKLRLQDIEKHVENLAVSDVVRAVQSTSSQNFINAIGGQQQKDGEAQHNESPFGGVSVADKVRGELARHLSDCGITLLRLSIEESKILDKEIAQQLAKQSLVSASAASEQAVLAQRSAIARSQAEVAAMEQRVKAEQQAQIQVTTARADLESAKLRAEARLLQAEAEAKAQELDGKLLQKYPELLQLRLAQMQFEALRSSNVTVMAPELASTPFALGAAGLWTPQNQQQVARK